MPPSQNNFATLFDFWTIWLNTRVEEEQGNAGWKQEGKAKREERGSAADMVRPLSRGPTRQALQHKGNTMTIYKASNGRCVGANVSEEEFTILVSTLPSGVYEVWQEESFLGHVTVKHGRIYKR
jgi:hypothetical protein